MSYGAFRLAVTVAASLVWGASVLHISDAHDREGWRIQPLTGDLDVYVASHLSSVLAEQLTDQVTRQDRRPRAEGPLKDDLDSIVTAASGAVQDLHGWVLDLSEVSFVDSAGLGVLARAYRRLRDVGMTLRLVSTDGHLARMLRNVGLAPLIPTYDTLEAATAPEGSALR